jgi:DNA-binding HxlR family transcriptional regulator
MNEIDEICKMILLSLLEGSKDFADLQRATNTGSPRTPRRHIQKHLVPRQLVSVKQKIKGRKTYYSIELTEKGRAVCEKIKGE